MRVFRGDPKYWGIDNTVLVSNFENRPASDAEMDGFFRRAESSLDRLALEMCADERAQGNRLPQWLLDYEAAAFNRTRNKNK